MLQKPNPQGHYINKINILAPANERYNLPSYSRGFPFLKYTNAGKVFIEYLLASCGSWIFTRWIPYTSHSSSMVSRPSKISSQMWQFNLSVFNKRVFTATFFSVSYFSTVATKTVMRMTQNKDTWKHAVIACSICWHDFHINSICSKGKATGVGNFDFHTLSGSWFFKHNI